MTASTQNVEALLRRTLQLSVPLHPGIAHFDEPVAEYQLAGAPGVALFHRDHPERIAHVSGSPSPALAEVLEDLRTRHLELAGLKPGADNSHVLPLLLLCLYVADEDGEDGLGLRRFARRPAELEALDEEAGAHDPELELDDAALRAWVPLEAAHAPGAGVHAAILELRFRAQRTGRSYVPPTG